MSVREMSENALFATIWVIVGAIVINIVWALAYCNVTVHRESMKAGLVQKQELSGSTTVWGKP